MADSSDTFTANDDTCIPSIGETVPPQKHHSEILSTEVDRGDELHRTRSRGQWKPTSLHSCAALIIALLLHVAAYCIVWSYSRDRGILAKANRSYDWGFQFAPTIVAVLFLIWCTQICRDYISISAFFPENVSSRARHKPRLYWQKTHIQALSDLRPKLLVACALLLLFCNSAVLGKAMLGDDVAVTSASTSNKQFLAALGETSLPPNGLRWETVQGVITEEREGWIVNEGSFFASVVVQFVMVLLILSLGMIRFPFERRWPRGLRSFLGHKTTGLIRTPTTLVALAEIFRAAEVRHIFQDIDSALPGQGSVVLSGNVSSLLCDHHIESHRNRDVGTIELHGVDQSTPQLRMRSSLPKHNERLLALRHAYVPIALRVATLLTTILFILLGLGLGAYLITAKRTYYLWIVNSTAQSTGDRHSAWAQQLLLAVLPLILLTTVWLWWSNVDIFYRALQPYAKFSADCIGRSSVCLDYSHTSLFVLPFGAAIRGHLRLAWLAFILLFGCLVLVLPAGLFSYNSILIYDHREAKPLQMLTTNRYKSDDKVFNDAVFQGIAVQAVLGSTVDQSWENDNTVFPRIRIRDGAYDVVLDGLSANLQCRQTEIDFKPQSLDGQLSARLNDDVLGQFEWSNFCYFDTKKLSSNGGQAVIADVNACPTQRPQSFNTTVNTTTTSRSSATTSSNISSTMISTPTRSRNSISTTKPTVSATASTRPGTTRECYKWYTPQPGEYCIEIAAQLGVNWTLIRDLNPDVDSDCRNLQAGVPYCVDGVINPTRNRVRRREDVSNTGCTGWFYVPSECSLNRSGFWLLVDVQGPFISTSKTQTGISSVGRSTSMICVPGFLSSTVNVTITSAANLTIRQNKVLSSKKVDIATWVSSDTGVQFNDFFGTGMIQHGFAGSYKQLSTGHILDRMSLLAASNSTTFTDGFRNFEEFQRTASHAFGLVFATVISQPLSSENATLLFESVKTQSNPQPLTTQRHILVATVKPIPLCIIMGFLSLVLLSIPCVYLYKSERTPLDPRYPANLIVSIYDSAFIQEVQNLVQRGEDPREQLKDRHFAFGVYEGVSNGDKRLGIDFAERVTIVNSRNRHAADVDAEKISIMSGRSSQFPELAEGLTVQELEGRGEFDVPVMRLTTNRSRWSRGETGYMSVPRRTDSDDVVFQNADDAAKTSPFSWLKSVTKGKSDGTTVSVRDVGTRSGSEETSLSSTVRRNWTRLINAAKGPLAQ